MKILIGILHPAHVHTFRNIISTLERHGHETKIVVIEKDITTKLLDRYNLDYDIVGKSRTKLHQKIFDFCNIERKCLRIIQKFKPDILLCRGFVGFALLSKLLKIPYIAFVDSDVTWMTRVQLPLIDVIITPSHYRFKLEPKQHVRLDTYKELAYLHPNWFSPNPGVLREANIRSDENIILLRFVAWEAYHDIGKRGFDIDSKRKLIKALERYGHIYISSELQLPEEFERYRIPIRVDQIHDFLYYAKLFVCDSQTMATEAAILGTPAIRCNTFVGENDMGNFIELEQEFGLIFNFSDPDEAINKAVQLVQDNNIKEVWGAKRTRLLHEKIDLTAFMVWFIENYPSSRTIIQQQPEIVTQFKRV
jgi:uncharacterized protein